MSRKYEASERLVITAGSSRTLAMLLAFMHIGALLALVLIPGNGRLRAGLFVLVCLSASSALRVHAFRSARHAIRRLEIKGENWHASSDSARLENCRVTAQFVHPWLVVLRLKPERGREVSVVLARDAVDAESFRALRARLNLLSLAA